jgi:2-methylcitrate dehydratase
LNNFADRDHCIEYIVAWCLLNGNLNSNSYSDSSASDENIDKLRKLTNTVEDQAYTRSYYDLDERAIPNKVVVSMITGEVYEKEVRYPLGHKERRAESLPFLKEKFEKSIKKADIREDELMKFYDEKNLDSINIYDLLNCIYK